MARKSSFFGGSLIPKDEELEDLDGRSSTSRKGSVFGTSLIPQESEEEELRRLMLEEAQKEEQQPEPKQKEARKGLGKLVDFGEAAGRFVAGKTSQTANLAREGYYGATGLAEILGASALGSDEDYKKKTDEIYNRLYGDEAEQRAKTGGVFGAGTGTDNREMTDMDGGDLTREIAGRGLGVAGEVVPFASAYKVASGAAKGGSLAARTWRGAKEGAAVGGIAGFGEELVDDEGFRAKDVGLSTILGGLFGGAGGNIGGRFAKGKTALAAKVDDPLLDSVDGRMDDVAGSLDTDDTFTRRLGTGEDRLQQRLDEIDSRLEEIQTTGGSTFSESPTTLKNAGSKTELTGELAFNRNRTDGNITTSADTTSGTLTPTDGTFKSSADEARALMREREQVVQSIQKATTPNEPATLSEALASTETPDVVPKTGKDGKPVRGASTQATEPPTLPERPNAPRRFFNKAFVSTKGRLAQLGEEGKKIADKIGAARDSSELAQRSFTKQIPTVLKMRKGEFSEFVDSLEALSRGETPAMSPTVQVAVDEWSAVIPTVRDAAVKAGIDVGDLGPYYFPHNYSDMLTKGDRFDEAIKHLVDTKQAANAVEAADLLKVMKRKYATPFGHFDNSRKLDLPGYDRSKDAMVSYIEGAFERISQAEQFGAKGELAGELLEGIRKKHGATAEAEGLKNYMIATGQYDWNRPASEMVSSKVRSFNRLRSLGLSAIMNAGQTVNTITTAGIWNTSKAALKLLSKAEREYVKDTGVIIDSAMKNLREQAGVTTSKGAKNKITAAGKWATDKLTAPGFNQIERFNRSVAAEAGKTYATKLARKGNVEELRKMGVTGKIGRKLTPEQEIQASRKLVERTQFKVDPQDLPGWASSPEGKLVAQFRTFAYKQTSFIYNEVLTEAAKGNVMPLTRFLAVGVPLGAGIETVREGLRGSGKNEIEGVEEKHAENTGDFMEALKNVGAFGLAGDAMNLGKNVGSRRFPQYAASTLAGPTAGLAIETADNISQLAQGRPESLGRQGLRSIPVAGPKISSEVLPYDSPLSDPQEEIVRGGGEDKQKYYDFFTLAEGVPKQRTDTLDTVNEAIKNKDFNKAKRLADDYNAGVMKSFKPFINEYGLEDENVFEELRSYLIPVDTPSMVKREKALVKKERDKLKGKW